MSDLILSEVLCTNIARIKDEAKVWFVGLEVVVVSCAHKMPKFLECTHSFGSMAPFLPTSNCSPNLTV